MSISGYSWRLVAIAGGRPLDLAELLGETLQLAKVEMLVGKPQHAVSAEREQDLPEIALAQRAAPDRCRAPSPRAPRLSVRW